MEEIRERNTQATNSLRLPMSLCIAYTSSPLLFTIISCISFVYSSLPRPLFLINVARDRYLTKDFNTGLGSEVRPSWKCRNTDDQQVIYIYIYFWTFQQYYLFSHGKNSCALFLPAMKFRKMTISIRSQST